MEGLKDANAAGAVIMEWAKKWGYDGREKAEGFTGIAKSVAGATSEEINNVAAIGNTLMYYVSSLPSIDSNVAIIRQHIEQSSPMAKSSANVDTTALWNRHLELQQGIYEHTRQSAEKCEAMALKCTQIAEDIHRVIVPRGGGSATASIQVRM